MIQKKSSKSRSRMQSWMIGGESVYRKKDYEDHLVYRGLVVAFVLNPFIR